jgi:hypothetical protein
MFEAETGITTREGPYGPYAYLSDKDQIEAALTWQESRCALIFLRDALDCSLALDLNLREPGVYTDIGLAEHNAKVNGNQEAITYLAGKCFSIISALGLYKDCTAVCAVKSTFGGLAGTTKANTSLLQQLNISDGPDVWRQEPAKQFEQGLRISRIAWR